MAHRRIQRLNEQLKRELSGLLRTEVRDPRVGLITITGVEITRDLSVAKVFVQPGEPAADPDQTFARLEATAPFLRGLLGKILKVRRVPELRFEWDRSLEHARRIEEILSDVLPDGDTGSADETAGSSPGAAGDADGVEVDEVEDAD